MTYVAIESNMDHHLFESCKELMSSLGLHLDDRDRPSVTTYSDKTNDDSSNSHSINNDRGQSHNNRMQWSFAGVRSASGLRVTVHVLKLDFCSIEAGDALDNIFGSGSARKVRVLLLTYTLSTDVLVLVLLVYLMVFVL